MRAITWNPKVPYLRPIGKGFPYAKGSFMMLPFNQQEGAICGSTSINIGQKTPRLAYLVLGYRLLLGLTFESHLIILLGAKSIFHKRLLKHQRTYRRNSN